MEIAEMRTYISNSWHIDLLESLKRTRPFKKGLSPVKVRIESCKD